MATEAQLDEIRNQLQRDLENQIETRNEQLEDEITSLRQILQMRLSPR